MRVAEHDFLARLSGAQGISAQSLCIRGAALFVVGFILSLSFIAESPMRLPARWSHFAHFRYFPTATPPPEPQNCLEFSYYFPFVVFVSFEYPYI